jgi:glycerate kinase
VPPSSGRPSLRALAAPSSLKGVLSALDAAAALAEGFRGAGVECDELPVADGGEGTLEALSAAGLVTRSHEVDVRDAFGGPRLAEWVELDGKVAVCEAAQAIPLDPRRRDVRAASSRGVGELIRAACSSGAQALVVTLGGTANMDVGAGLLEVLDTLPVPTRVACDVQTKLADAPRLYGPQKGASPDDVRELTAQFAHHAFGHLAGSGAAGGLGAALASLGAELVPGGPLVLELLRFDPRGYDVVVTGEGTVDETTFEGKAPAAVADACERAGVRCVVFGGRVLAGDAVALTGIPGRAREDLVTLGSRLARDLARR